MELKKKQGGFPLWSSISNQEKSLIFRWKHKNKITYNVNFMQLPFFNLCSFGPLSFNQSWSDQPWKSHWKVFNWTMSTSTLFIFHWLWRLAICMIQIRSDQISRSVVSNSLQSPWIIARQASLSITNSRSSLRLMSIESVMPSSHLILCRPLLLLPPIPPSIRVFSNESTRLQLFYILCQNVYQPAWMIDFRFFIVGYALH